ncbi:mitotic spindle assembly checkpoint protein MAD2A [Nilaparvata lugens]|uniref:mitotic spindle assembly checkpoint protein MAD2A n=1 Tax=Nilaparvata lugens TaxID=108931 RepID=UPI000B98E95B|nr:mitotic spindle assembly checkpoint protein MAD2A [Nilaparvata lugens]XP_022199489.1 mitotic spindle assembly checkpoint protein MAD2A [Nilaparvata lugens]
MSQTQTRNAITLKGSAQLVTEYLNFGINSILYQRGIYPAENFRQEQHFGLQIYVSTDDKINSFLDSVLGQIKEWLAAQKIKKMSMVISNVQTKEVLERWDFNLQYEKPENTSTVSVDGKEEIYGKKEIKVIQSEIRSVLLQICSTVSVLPLLDCPCAFDLLIYTPQDCEVPEMWDETEPCFIANSQEIQLRTFSTTFHKMNTIVSYKAE